MVRLTRRKSVSQNLVDIHAGLARLWWVSRAVSRYFAGRSVVGCRFVVVEKYDETRASRTVKERRTRCLRYCRERTETIPGEEIYRQCCIWRTVTAV